jgi:TonB family protein
VSVEIVVGAEGVPRALRVRKSLGLGLDEEAIAAVRTWRFGPGMREGVPVPVIARVDVNFRLFDTPMIVWHLEAVNFDAPVGASRPEVIRSAFPKEVQGEDASVSVSFDITEKGEPTNLTLVNAAFLNSEATVLESVTQWRFKPATKDGTPIPVRATFNFVHHGR